MRDSILAKLTKVADRYQQIAEMLSSAAVMEDQKKFCELSKEYATLEPVVTLFTEYQQKVEQITQTKLSAKDPDLEIRELAIIELDELNTQREELEKQLQVLLLPKDPNDERNVFLEVRAGTGGDEAALFAGDLFRMYCRYAEISNWQVEIINESLSEQGGYKEVIARVIGKGAYSKLKFESGVHRVQRVPTTESQGRIHTSACTVAILPEVEVVECVEINNSELRIDTFRASGAGGQHVNRTNSAIRITHLPTGIVVECQEDRSQHKNKAKAMSLLYAKILEQERSKQQQQQASQRKSLIGSGDRSERIRTYNFPQGRITDHRINLTVYKLAAILEGELQHVIEPLCHEHQMDLLASFNQS